MSTWSYHALPGQIRPPPQIWGLLMETGNRRSPHSRMLSQFSARSTAIFRGGRSLCTVFQIVGKSIRSYWWRSQFPMPRMSRHGRPEQRVSASLPSRMAASLMICNLRSTAAIVFVPELLEIHSGSERLNHGYGVRDVAQRLVVVSKRQAQPPVWRAHEHGPSLLSRT